MLQLVTTRMTPITFDIDPDLTALLVIDMQNGFAAPRGTIGAAGMDISMTRGIIPNIQRLLDAARASGMHVFSGRQDAHPAAHPRPPGPRRRPQFSLRTRHLGCRNH